MSIKVLVNLPIHLEINVTFRKNCKCYFSNFFTEMQYFAPLCILIQSSQIVDGNTVESGVKSYQIIIKVLISPVLEKIRNPPKNGIP